MPNDETAHPAALAVAAPPPAGAAPLALFGADADAVLQRATHLAGRLADLVRRANLSVRIQGREYVKCEGWTTLAAMLRLCPRVASRRLERDGEIVYEARAELVAVDGGAVLYAADALCSSKERRWATADEYAIRSMAQTRATAKACRVGLSFVMSLAGYEATPAEEIPDEPAPPRQPRAPVAPSEPKQASAPKVRLITAAQGKRLWARAASRAMEVGGVTTREQIVRAALAAAGVEHTADLPASAYDAAVVAVDGYRPRPPEPVPDADWPEPGEAG